MSDYNDELLPEPCLRMDTHFGDEYESVEFGDGTGYIKAVPTLARFGALNAGMDKLRDENAKLRELVRGLLWCNSNPWNNGACDDCPISVKGVGRCDRIMRELGIEDDGWPIP